MLPVSAAASQPSQSCPKNQEFFHCPAAHRSAKNAIAL